MQNPRPGNSPWKFIAHTLPPVMAALSALLVLVSKLFDPNGVGGTFYSLGMILLVAYPACAILGGVVGLVSDIRSLRRREAVRTNVLLLILSAVHTGIGALLIIFAEEISAM